MTVYLLSIIGAFLLFAVILPLVGIVLGLFCSYVLPYLFGGLVSIGLLGCRCQSPLICLGLASCPAVGIGSLLRENEVPQARRRDRALPCRPRDLVVRHPLPPQAQANPKTLLLEGEG